MLNLYEHVMTSITTVLKRYKLKNVTSITGANVLAQQPDYPYISLEFLDQGQHLGATFKSGVMLVPVQILCTSNNKWQALDIGHWINCILFERQPLIDLSRNHVVPKKHPTPSNFNKSFLQNGFEFSSGGRFIFSVGDPIRDDTQEGYIEHVNGNMDGESFHADDND